MVKTTLTAIIGIMITLVAGLLLSGCGRNTPLTADQAAQAAEYRSLSESTKKALEAPELTGYKVAHIGQDAVTSKYYRIFLEKGAEPVNPDKADVVIELAGGVAHGATITAVVKVTYHPTGEALERATIEEGDDYGLYSSANSVIKTLAIMRKRKIIAH